jgi:hypothetical protein
MFGWGRTRATGPSESSDELPTLTTFSGWLRHHRADHNNIWGEAVFRFAFPGFDPPKWTEEEIASAKRNASPYVNHLVLQPAQHRRYGGYDLPRGRYYSLSSDGFGNDLGTISAELRAYRDRSDQDVIVDVVDGIQFPDEFFHRPLIPAGIRRAKDACIIVSIFPASRLRRIVETFGSAGRARMSEPETLKYLTDENLVQVMLLPRVTHHSIDGVVDLRQPDTRRTFFDVFRVGRPPDPSKLKSGFYRPLGDQISDFWQMVPDLVDPHLGGTDEGQGGVTQAIGDYLRLKGVSGLVYPSARTDSYVEFRDGTVTGSGGWNFVDYRNAPKSTDHHFMIVSPWEQRTLQGVQVQSPPQGPFAGSFKISGLREANDARYEASYAEQRRALFERLQAGPPAVLLWGSTNLDVIAQEQA